MKSQIYFDSPDPRADGGVPMQRSSGFLHRAFGHLADRQAVFPVWRTDGDEPRESARSPQELRIADGHERAGFGNLIEIGHSLGLRVAVLEQPRLALERRRVVRIERLVPVEQN